MRAGLTTVMTLAAAALAAGCYQPKLKNFGFACDSSAPKPCPNGYFCNGGFCDDGSGGSPPATGGNGGDQDMAMSSGGSGGGGGGGSGGGGGTDDMAVGTPDMAKPPVQDMAKPADMVVVSMCAHDECTAGTKLASGCSACVTEVCKTGNDPSCCTSNTHGWDSICVSEVNDFCTSKTCP